MHDTLNADADAVYSLNIGDIGKSCYAAAAAAEGRKKKRKHSQTAYIFRSGKYRFPVPARPTFSVEKWLFSVTLCQGAGSQALQLRF
jgi:hypothetical protein